ncbi:MAG TPA: hypothetical protein VM582_07480, partial [Candidatus Thermoplasmatota archaeon]|nr:hypothetical protein [Candidatus Thermoplasmatota archaeon]
LALLPLALAVVGAGVGAVFGLSLGAWGVAVAALLAAAGLALRRDALAWAALAAVLLPFAAVLAVVAAAPASHALFYAAALGPALSWLALAAAWRAQQKEGRGASPPEGAP